MLLNHINRLQSTTESTRDSTALHDELAQVLHQFEANTYATNVRVHALKAEADAPIIRNESNVDEKTMKTIQVYDKPMCCSTGVCGPQIDPVLPRFAADLDWLKSQGNRVERFNLAQQPAAFVQNNDVHQLLVTEGTDCLPLIVVDGRVVSRREYPAREILASWTQTSIPDEARPLLQ